MDGQWLHEACGASYFQKAFSYVKEHITILLRNAQIDVDLLHSAIF